MNFMLPFLKREQIAKDAFLFSFDRRSEHFDFLPGQFTSMSLFSSRSRTFDSTRDFSVASSPLDKNVLSIITKPGVSDFKQRLFSIKSGEMVGFTRPSGGFVFDLTHKKQHVFLAGGIGIVPFASMIRQYSAEGIPITLIASFSFFDELIFIDELEDIVQKNTHIQIIITLTKGTFIQKGTFYGGMEVGRISRGILQKYVHTISDAIFYVAGPEHMVDEMESLLEELDASKVRVEYFTGYI